MNWAWLVTSEPDALGEAGRDLDLRWNDPEEHRRVKRRAEFLRAGGTSVLTLADPEDAVVRPDEALLPAPGETRIGFAGGGARHSAGQPRPWRASWTSRRCGDGS